MKIQKKSMKYGTLLFAAATLLTACSSTPTPSVELPTESWNYADGNDAPYLIAPGDELEIVVHTAPELNRTVVVNPDGRIQIPFSAPVVANARTPMEVRKALMASLQNELRNPDLDVIISEFGSQQIFVGGEVENVGMLPLPGKIDPLQAVIMAGGFTDEARQQEVVVIRRLPGGDVRSVVLDLKSGVFDPEFAAWLPLRRFDVVYVPKSRIANQNQWIRQYIRQALPIEFSLFYDVSDIAN